MDSDSTMSGSILKTNVTNLVEEGHTLKSVLVRTLHFKVRISSLESASVTNRLNSGKL